MTKPNTSCTTEMPASLRSESVQVYPGMQSILSSVPPNKVAAVREDARCLKVRCAMPLRAYAESYVF
jgi:hypothetical protein